MNEHTDVKRERDVSPERFRKAVARMDYADKLFANAVMQLGLAFDMVKVHNQAEKDRQS